tara:strand:- start:84 stop:2528 length:2445 start_codon:yes stop_codon:yes gene_type:complete
MFNNIFGKIFNFLFLIFLATSIFSYSSAYAITEPGGQYAIDKADQVKRFEHNSLDNLKMIDFFLCVMKVRADLFPNSNYKAQVNEATCQKLAGDSDEDGAKVKMADITLSCTRASNSSPQICKSWYSLAGESTVYLVKVQMDAEPTTTKPNGLFTFTWCMADQTDGTCKASNLAYGQLGLSEDGSGNTVVSMYDEYGAQIYSGFTSEGVTLQDSNGVALSSATSVVDSINLTLSNHKLESATGTSRQIGQTFVSANVFRLNANPTTYNLSFDAAHGLVNEDGGSASCYTLSNPSEYVHQYDLYDISTGALKSMGGGIPITVASAAAGSTATAGNRGWWDYWGLHIDGSTNSSIKKLASGSTVTANAAQSTLGISKDDTLTLNTSMGSLREETSYTGTVPAVDQAAATTTMYFWSPSGKEYIYLDGTTIKALPSANGGDGGTHRDGSTFSAGDDISAALEWCGNSDIQDYCFGANSTAIGGWFNISDISEKEFKAYVSKRVTPGMSGFTSDVYLKCYGDRCSKPMDGGSLSTVGFGATDFKASHGSTYKYSFIDPSGGTPKYYMFDVSDMTLKHCETWNSSSNICTGDLYPVICATDEGSDKCDNTEWDSTTWLDMTMVKHDVTIGSWANLDSATRYIWNTSNNVYGDRLAWPTKSSTVISFSPPVNITYDHTTSNDRNASSTYNGKKFGLEYGGSGNLWGIDWYQETPSCTADCDWLPQISIKDGVEVDTTGDGSNDHVLLARRIDLRPSTVSEATCTDKGLSVASSASAPSTPAIETIIDFGTSDEPTGGSLVSTEVCVVDNILSGAAGCPTE